MKIVTCIAPVNIAVIKYWGKRDESLILPINDSISCTLSTDHMCAKTTIMISPSFDENQFWLNGKEESLDHPRLNACLQEIKKRANKTKLGDLLQWKLHICSENNFPTAAGLASSAAGYACLVSALAAIYNIDGDVSAVARKGSGSACRSIYGGWVHWIKGALPSGEDSIAKQIVPSSFWPEMRIVVLVVNDTKKKHSSTVAMKRGVDTSDLLTYRAEHIVPKRIIDITEAIKRKDFHTFAQLTMQDSNQFHATCLDTYPPCVYLNDISHSIIDVVHAYNNHKGSNKVAYTFDAGPNACLYLLESEVPEFVGLIRQVFPSETSNSEAYLRGEPIAACKNLGDLRSRLNLGHFAPGALKYIIHTKAGEGPRILTDPTEHLLTQNGLPIK